MPAGRPSKYHPDMCETAKAFMAEGYSKEALAGRLGICKQTLCAWQNEKPEFAEALKEGEAMSQMWWEDRGREACTNGQFNAVVWAMNMKNRFGWRDKVEHTGDGSEPLVVNISRISFTEPDES